MFPPNYRIVEPPASYKPERENYDIFATPTPMGATPGFVITQTPAREEYGVPIVAGESGMPHIDQEDMKFFKDLLTEVDEDELSSEEVKKRKIMRLLLKIKKGEVVENSWKEQFFLQLCNFRLSELTDHIMPSIRYSSAAQDSLTSDNR